MSICLDCKSQLIYCRCNTRRAVMIPTDIKKQLMKAYEAGYREALKDAAEEAKKYWQSGKNVYARHAGRAVEARILRLGE